MKKIIIFLLSLFVLTGCGRKEVTFDTTKEVTTAYTSENWMFPICHPSQVCVVMNNMYI